MYSGAILPRWKKKNFVHKPLIECSSWSSIWPFDQLSKNRFLNTFLKEFVAQIKINKYVPCTFHMENDDCVPNDYMHSTCSVYDIVITMRKI